MKHAAINIFLFCLSVFVVTPLLGQNAVHYYFRTLDIRNGLSQNTVNAIMQDKQGFMWFGTKDGLNRFDGLNFRVFKKENSNLGNNFITALYEDRDGLIWIGTDAGVYTYNPLLEAFSKFDLADGSGNSIERSVTMIKSDENGDIWISADSEGLFHYDRRQNRLFCSFTGPSFLKKP